MSISSRSQFERCALASGLLTAELIDQARRSLEWPDGRLRGDPTRSPDERLADRLVELGRLNLWQAQQLLAGRSRFSLGPYLVFDSIGKGGMGQVFKATHGVLGQIVAVKVLPRDRSTPEAIERFSNEIRFLSQLDHPNLVRAIDAGEDGNVHYLVTEYVPGATLRNLVRVEGVLSMEKAASILSQVAAALQHAHEHGLIHRDIKPGNVLVTPEGVAKLSDLGLASPMCQDPEKAPWPAVIVGTADYLSPDQIKAPGLPAPGWDIYSLGCTLYYAVTGKVPFPGGSLADKARAHCELRPLDPRRLNPLLSAPFVEVMADLMAKSPHERIATAADVVTRLAPWTGESDESLPVTSSSSDRLGAAFTTSDSGLLAEMKTGMEDTEVSFSGCPDVVSSTGHHGDASRVSAPDPDPTGPAAYLAPLAFFLAFPLSLVGAVLLLAQIARLLGFG